MNLYLKKTVANKSLVPNSLSMNFVQNTSYIVIVCVCSKSASENISYLFCSESVNDLVKYGSTQ